MGPASTDGNGEISEVRALEARLRAGGVKEANVVVELLGLITQGGGACIVAVHATRRALASLEKPAALEETLGRWVRARNGQFGDSLAALVHSNAASTAEVEAAVAAAAFAGEVVWRKIVEAVLNTDASLKERREIVGELFVARFADLRLVALDAIARGVGSFGERLDMLSYCALPVEKGSARTKGAAPSQKEMRKAFSAAWFSVLKDPSLTLDYRRRILERVPFELIPNMSHPLRLADFLTDCYNDGQNISIAMAALDGLFVLISKHGLDYPLFYPKLYALLTPEALFYAENRDRFLEMTALFLRQGALLPGGLVAAFIKRLARRALVAPPAGAMWCLRLAIDLLYKHPSVSFLVHRSVNLFDIGGTEKLSASGSGPDPFDDEELDPQASRAAESSLWELEALRNHISPAVSRLVEAFAKDVRRRPPAPPGALEDYAGLTFQDVFEAEFKRRAKTIPLAYDAPGQAPGVREVLEDIGGAMSWS